MMAEKVPCKNKSCHPLKAVSNPECASGHVCIPLGAEPCFSPPCPSPGECVSLPKAREYMVQNGPRRCRPNGAAVGSNCAKLMVVLGEMMTSPTLRRESSVGVKRRKAGAQGRPERNGGQQSAVDVKRHLGRKVQQPRRGGEDREDAQQEDCARSRCGDLVTPKACPSDAMAKIKSSFLDGRQKQVNSSGVSNADKTIFFIVEDSILVKCLPMLHKLKYLDIKFLGYSKVTVYVTTAVCDAVFNMTKYSHDTKIWSQKMAKKSWRYMTCMKMEGDSSFHFQSFDEKVLAVPSSVDETHQSILRAAMELKTQGQAVCVVYNSEDLGNYSRNMGVMCRDEHELKTLVTAHVVVEDSDIATSSWQVYRSSGRSLKRKRRKNVEE